MFKKFELKKKHLILVALSGFIISLDQATKVYIYTHFNLHSEWPVIENFFSITYIRNYGAAFGFLGTAQENFRDVFFLIMPPVALLIILLILHSVPEKDKSSILALSSIFGGAIGNYIDRIRFGFVVDFLDFYIPKNFLHFTAQAHHWPAFNIADMAIVCGVGILLFIEWGKLRGQKASSTSSN